MYLRLKVFLFFIVSFCSFSYSQSPPAIFMDTGHMEIQNTIAFDQLFSQKKVVGLGEATHGDRESQLMRLAVIKRLVEHHQFKNICLELGPESAHYMDSIIHLPQNLNQRQVELALLHSFFWIYKTYEFEEIIKWLHAYNQNHKDKMSIVGVDTYAKGRDSAMVAKVFQLSQSAKSIYIAHNYHVSFENAYFFRESERPAGYHLKQYLGDAYYALGVLCNRPCFVANNIKGVQPFCVDLPKKLNTYGAYFREHRLNFSIIDFDSLHFHQPKLKQDKKTDYNYYIGSIYFEGRYTFRKDFLAHQQWDGVFFVDSLTAAQNYLVPGVLYGRTSLTLDKKMVDIKEIKVEFNYEFNSDTGKLNPWFIFYAQNKKGIVKLPVDTVFKFKEAQGSFTQTFQVDKRWKYKSVLLDFMLYGDYGGCFKVYDLKVNGIPYDQLVSEGAPEIDFKGGNRFGIKHEKGYDFEVCKYW